MAWSVKAVIKSKPLADGKFAIYLRLTAFGKVSYIATGVRTDRRHWNPRMGQLKTSAPLSMESNEYLDKLLAQLKKTVMEGQNLSMSPKALLKMVAEKPVDFYGYCERFIQARIEKKQFTTANIYRVQTDLLKAYAPQLSVTDITTSFVNKLVAHMTSTGNSDTTINRKLSFFAGVFELIMEDGLAKKNYFNDARISGTKSRIKEIPTADDLKALVLAMPAMSDVVRLAAEMFLTQFLTRGTRISDIIFLKKESVVDGHLVFHEKKTNKPKRINIHPLVRDFMAQYNCPVYVFPHCTYVPNAKLSEADQSAELVKATKRLTASTNKNLRFALKAAGITKHFSTHSSRHGFATMAIQALGDLRKVQGMLNHANQATTEGYAQDLQRSDYTIEEQKIYGQIWKNEVS
jgi:site-specific recombinase XerD